MQTIKLHTFELHAPDTLSELTQEQCKLFAGAIYHGLEVNRLRLLMFFSFVKNGFGFWQKAWYQWHIVFKPYLCTKTFIGKLLFNVLGIDVTIMTLSDDSIIELAEFHTSWLIDNDNIITQQKFEKLAGYIAPSNSLNNLCFRQFRMAEEFALLYAQTKNEVYLNTLLAWLFLPQDAMQDDTEQSVYRAALMPASVKIRATQIAKVDIDTRYYLYLWYLNAKNTIQQKFDGIWEGSSGSDKPRIKTGNLLEKLRDNFSAMLVIRADHVTKMEDTDFSPLFDVLQFFKTEAAQAELMKR